MVKPQLNLLGLGFMILLIGAKAQAATQEFNSSGGTSGTNGLHVYIGDMGKMQIKRLNNTGQLYDPTVTPANNQLDNGVFLRANGKVYGESHQVSYNNTTKTQFSSDFPYSSYSISNTTPANPVGQGVQQRATSTFQITSGPTLSIVWKYTSPYDFIIAEVTLTIPSGYAVSSANPVRYYHVIDTYLGGNDYGCGVKYTDNNGKLVVGTYPPVSGNTCTSTTAVPTGASITESFRERSGGVFSSYCAADWQSFWWSDSNNCYIKQSASLSNFIAPSFRDTGVAIEYDFTSAGTYTFSYDFVIGTSIVPAYEHLELQHTGSSNLCPTSVTVLGCLVGTVPCPSDQLLYAGLSGTMTPSGGTPAMTWTPSTFTLSSSVAQQTLTLQTVSPGGTVTLGATGLNKIPLSGVQCWNQTTNTQSCSFTFSNASCYADKMDACSNTVSPPTPARCGASGNRLYTKVVGDPIAFDLVALNAGPPVAVNSTYTSNASNPVTVDLVAVPTGGTLNATTGCPNAPVALSNTAQVVPFTSGRPASASTYTVAAANNATAYRQVLVRFDQGGGHVNCTHDAFAIRPLSLSAVSAPLASADASGLSASATPVVKTGAAFTLIADSGTIGYDGVPQIDSGKLEWLNAPAGGVSAPGAGILSGSFSSAANSSSGNGASGSFTYNEVGYFRFQAQGVHDDTFTATSGDKANGDCSNTSPNNFSNTISGGQYGCNFGNLSATSYFGRFIPDHFAVSSKSLSNRTDLSCSPATFTYMGEPLSTAFTLTAQNADNVTTSNYSGSFARLDGSSQTTWLNTSPGMGFSGVDTSLGGFSNSRLGIVPSGSWSGGVANFSAIITFNRTTTVDGPYDAMQLYLAPKDSDNVTMAATVLGSTKVRFGRMRLHNAYGSELLQLPVPVAAEYFQGAGGFVPNTDDSCTGLAAGSFALANPTGALSAGDTSPILTQTACPTSMALLCQGQLNLKLGVPGAGHHGSIDLTLSAPAWLQYDWDGNGVYADNPVARAVFGLYKGGLIDFREAY